MPAHTFRSLIVALCVGAILSPLSVAAADKNIVAQVGSVPVTVYDVSRELQKLLPFNVSFHSGIPKEKLAKMEEDALNAVVERAYKVNYAIDNKLKADQKQIDDRIAAAKKRFKSESEFKKALNGENPKDLRRSVEHDFLAQLAEEKAVSSRISISDAEVRSYYDANKNMYNRPRQFRASHILVKVDPSANQTERMNLETKAKDLAKRAKAGEDFYNLAYYNSDDRSKYVGGDLGTFHEGQTVPEFEESLRKLKVGEISAPVKSMYGWHIIKLVELNEPRLLEFDEVKTKIREQLEKKNRETLYADWMTELKAKYPFKKF